MRVLKYFGLLLLGVLLFIFLTVGMDYWKPGFRFPTVSISDEIRAQPDSIGRTTRFPLVPDGPVRNVILFLGDGMGTSHLTAARMYARGPDGRLVIDRLPVLGMHTTHSANQHITDSAAGATALATGHKTRNGRVSMSLDSLRLPTLLEAARARGMATGLVTTSYVTDATLAAFATHVLHRSEKAEIARQYLAFGVDVLMGSGRGWFLPTSDGASARGDDLDLVGAARDRGYAIAFDEADLKRSTAPRLLGLFDDTEIAYDNPTLTLAEMTTAALEVLQRHEGGFFLVVEQEHTDTDAHRDALEDVVRHVLRLDAAVDVGIRFAREQEETLVVVTADHETGGLAITGGSEADRTLEVEWAVFRHTGAPAPVFAYGPGAIRFTGFYDNTGVARRLGAAIGLEAFPPPVGQ